jgi:hypothetical protein
MSKKLEERNTPPFFIGKIKEKKDNKVIYWNYRNIKYDKNGWANAEEYLPDQFDLCFIKTENNRVLKGWHTGQIWDGLNVNHTHKIKYWKWFEEKE